MNGVGLLDAYATHVASSTLASATLEKVHVETATPLSPQKNVDTPPESVPPDGTAIPLPSHKNEDRVLENRSEYHMVIDQMGKIRLNNNTEPAQKSANLGIMSEASTFQTPPTTPPQAGVFMPSFDGTIYGIPNTVLSPFHINNIAAIRSYLLLRDLVGMNFQNQQYNTTIMSPPIMSPCSPGTQIGSSQVNSLLHSLQEQVYSQQQTNAASLQTQNILHNQQSHHGSYGAQAAIAPSNVQENNRTINQVIYPSLNKMEVDRSAWNFEVKQSMDFLVYQGNMKNYKGNQIRCNKEEVQRLRLDYYCNTSLGLEDLVFVIKEVKDHFRLNHGYMCALAGIPSRVFTVFLRNAEPGVVARKAATWFHQFMRHPENAPGYLGQSSENEKIFQKECQIQSGRTKYNEERVDTVLCHMEGNINTKTYASNKNPTKRSRVNTRKPY